MTKEKTFEEKLKDLLLLSFRVTDSALKEHEKILPDKEWCSMTMNVFGALWRARLSGQQMAGQNAIIENILKQMGD